jgi:hypothetical protein
MKHGQSALLFAAHVQWVSAAAAIAAALFQTVYLGSGMAA